MSEFRLLFPVTVAVVAVAVTLPAVPHALAPEGVLSQSSPVPKTAPPPPAGAAPHAGTPPEIVRNWPFVPFASELTRPLELFVRMPAVVSWLSVSVFVPVMVVLPFSETAPWPVENVDVAPVWEKLPVVVTLPVGP